MNALNKGLLRLFERYMPDPLVLTALITIFVFLAGMILKAQSPVAMAQSWYGGFFTLHAFAMQIILILVAGYAIARSPAFGRLVDWLARMATTPTRAIVLVTGCTLVVTWLNYGIGLVIGAILARELVQRVKGVDYRVLIAGAYAGFIVWHGGLSGAAPLGVATKGNFLEAKIGGLIPVSQTIFSGVNLSLSVLVSVVLILTLVIVGRNIDDPVGLNSDAPEAAPAPATDSIEATPANRLENSRILGLVIGLLGLATILWYFLHDGGLNLNSTAFALIFMGIALHGSLRNYLKVVAEGVTNSTGVVIQFPFYAGIMGMMKASGMSGDIAQFFIQVANPHTLPLLTFWSAGLINLFVPSGGGQWAIQGPIVVDAAKALGVAPAASVVGFAWGDAWTNLIQPFWALPALAIAGLKAKDIMGFCTISLVTTGITISIILFIGGMIA